MYGNVKGNPNLIILDRDEIKRKVEEAYGKGFKDGVASVSAKAETKQTVSKAKAKVKTDDGETVELRNAVVEKDADDKQLDK